LLVETYAWGVNHAIVFWFPNVVCKSANVKPLSALKNSSVDTFRFVSCRPLSPATPWLSRISRYRVHGENRLSIVECETYCAGLFSTVVLRLRRSLQTDGGATLESCELRSGSLRWCVACICRKKQMTQFISVESLIIGIHFKQNFVQYQ
jgi:hypothetical protein